MNNETAPLSDERLRGFDFGDYAWIEQHCYGVPNEMFQYKVIQVFQSNSWIDAPVRWDSKPVLHKWMEPVARCICCGVVEDTVQVFRLADLCKSATPPADWLVRGAALQLDGKEKQRD